MTSIEIPNSVKEIGVCAFQDCINLSVVTFEQGSKLKEFGDGYAKTGYRPFVTGAFANCTALKSIQIPANVEKIGVGTFISCKEGRKTQKRPTIQVHGLWTPLQRRA